LPDNYWLGIDVKIIISSCLAVLLACGASFTRDDQEQLDEIIIAHMRVDWSGSAAFYVDAPSRLRANMNEKLNEYVTEDISVCDASSNESWLCSETNHRYFRGISGKGKEIRDGIVCSGDDDIPRQDYYSGRMLLAHAYCIDMVWQDDEQEYWVFVPDDT
jgi:hypothetical protein